MEVVATGLTCPSGYTDLGRVVEGASCSITCTDSDCVPGSPCSTDTLSLRAKGTVTAGLSDGTVITLVDKCISASQLGEYSCNGNLAGFTTIPTTSPKSCVDGAIVG